jgi:wyosine [tRNA(Phe)-imidazoG37] synthetase (radical SAM superfamily)
MRLSTKIHDRDAAGFVHVYPVVSRRARGVSIGVNLNTNNACNWRCAYCQVPDLVLGAAPEIDLDLLETELRTFLDAVVNGDYLERQVPADSRRLNDIALSGNGEPTTSKQIDAVLERVTKVLAEFDLLGRVKLVLITNGSLIDRPEVGRALAAMARANGEVWFKLDSATPEGRNRLNDARIPTERVKANLILSASLCPTYIQTIAVGFDGEPPSESEQLAYIELLASVLASGAELRDVLLYGLERVSYQPEASRLTKLSTEWLEAFGARIEAGTGLLVSVHP